MRIKKEQLQLVMTVDIEWIKNKLKRQMKEKRFKHTLGVVDAAVDLAKRFGVDVEKAKLAAVLHDCAKEYSSEKLLTLARENGIEIDAVYERLPHMLHAPVGAVVAEKEYGIKDIEVLQAIAAHTLGSENMSELDKVIMLADAIEIGRKNKSAVELRNIIEKGASLDEAVICCIDFKIKFVLESKQLIHPQAVNARNALLIKKL